MVRIFVRVRREEKKGYILDLERDGCYDGGAPRRGNGVDVGRPYGVRSGTPSSRLVSESPYGR